jgi:hypothetical protein
MLYHRNRLASQDRLIYSQRGREDFCQSNVGRNFIAHRYFDHIARNYSFGANFLHARFIRSDHFTHFWFVFFQRFDGRFGVSFLLKTVKE